MLKRRTKITRDVKKFALRGSGVATGEARGAAAPNDRQQGGKKNDRMNVIHKKLSTLKKIVTVHIHNFC
jgi:hypothetical protein